MEFMELIEAIGGVIIYKTKLRLEDKFINGNLNHTLEHIDVNGNIYYMIWLKANGGKFNDVTFNYAVRDGNLEIMKWLKDNGCKFSCTTFYHAVEKGNLDNMKWLLSNGCPH